LYQKEEIEKKIISFLKAEETPTNTNNISINIGITFGTCKKALKKLKDENKIVAIKTSRCTFFTI